MNIQPVSNTLQLNRFSYGVKLCESSDDKRLISAILKLPMAIYFEDREGIIQKANAMNAELCCGFDSPEAAMGKKYFRYIKKCDAIKLRKNDVFVLKNNRPFIAEENMTQKQGQISSTLSIKLPWYNDQNKIVGLFGCSILLGNSPLAESLRYIAELGLLTGNEGIKNLIGKEINQVYLSKRQLECAKLLLQGLTTKEIAKRLHLSTRTVEHYFDNIKLKLNCQNRTDLIIKLYEYLKHNTPISN